MAHKIKQYTNPFLKAKEPLLAPEAATLPNLLDAIALHQQGMLGQAQEIYRQLLEIEPRNADALHLLGVIAFQTGSHQSSVDLIDQAIEINSNVESYHSNQGNALKELKQLDAAVASYDKAIALKPDYAEAYSNRGASLLELKKLDAAIHDFDKAVALKPDFVQAYYNRGTALHELEQLDAAVASFDKVIELKPDFFQAYYNRGTALHELKQLDAAVASFNKVIELKPEFAEAFFNRGVTLKELKQLDAAVASYDKAIALKPDFVQAYYNRGNALQVLKQLDAAVASYDKAIALKPDYALAYSNRGASLLALKQLDAAVASFNKAIELNPDYAEAYANRGTALHELKQLDAAVASYDKAIALKPDYALAYSNRGATLLELKQLVAAIDNFDKAIELDPAFADAYFNRGATLKELKQLDAAVASFDKAFDLNPEDHYLVGQRQHARMLVCDWSNFAKNILLCESEIASNKPATTPFIALILVDNPALHLQSAKIFMEAKHPKNQALGKIAKRTAGGKLRLGYFSADLHYHPVAIWLAEQIENHDKSKFELFAFSFRTEIKDPMTARLEAAFDHFIAVDKMSDLAVAQLSRQLGVDIALDLTGYTGGSRTGIFALQAAPIQVSHLGFPGSMGAEYIDYVIADEHLLPQGSAKYYTEKIAYMPCGYTYDRQRQLSLEPLSRAHFGLPEKGFVFTCQNGCQKFLPEVFGIWMDILRAVPASVLWLMEPHPSAMANLIKEAQAQGVESDRLVFTKREKVPEDQEQARIGRYLASYKLADLFLDTWPYNAGTTAVDALWAGLPVLTKSGEAMVARLATSVLHAVEVPELITNTAQEYRNLAVELASDPRKLKLITDKLQANRLTSALFDPVGNTRHIEAAYLEMYRRYQADLPPDHLYIEP
jgi:predicted O-linked N-acetylglucosamine transferase (SPINDLY family)